MPIPFESVASRFARSFETDTALRYPILVPSRPSIQAMQSLEVECSYGSREYLFETGVCHAP
ncbi:hypothetical protein BCAR13_60066 [Paraburkholderia caribensis]|nr:hypothetical protein BCAR13_60066 [Paraburkholderia caribensis]